MKKYIKNYLLFCLIFAFYFYKKCDMIIISFVFICNFIGGFIDESSCYGNR